MRLTVAEISFDRLAHNLNFIKDNADDALIMPAVKANAYGHGMIDVSIELMRQGISMFAVAFADEGIRLRAAGISGDIFVLLPEMNGNAELWVMHNLTPVVSSVDFIEVLNEESKKLNIVSNAHLFINTGMNREGIRPEEALEFMNSAGQLDNVEVNGICTHFATASSHMVFANQQLESFNSTLDMLKSNGFNFKWIHAANSAAAVLLPESRFNIIRPGLALYGYPPTEEADLNFNVKPIMKIISQVVSTRTINEGDTAGYGLRYVADKETKIATIPIGYGDGYFRGLSNKAECLINGRRYPLIGVISMDSSIVDVGNDNIQVGDEVVILGSQGEETISAYELANFLGTIPYEITTAVSERVPRVYKS